MGDLLNGLLAAWVVFAIAYCLFRFINRKKPHWTKELKEFTPEIASTAKLSKQTKRAK